MARDKMIPPQPPTDQTPWERFEAFAKRVIAIPKDAVGKSKETRQRKKEKRRID